MSDHRKKRRTARVLAAAVAAVLTLGLASGAYPQGTEVASAVGRPPVPARPAPLRLPARPRVLVMGDSYAAGWGATPMTAGFAYRLAGPLSWRVTVDGVGTTGYWNAGSHHQGTYAQRLSKYPVSSYDLIVLQGGSNDEKKSAATITKAVDLTIRTAHRRFPSAQLLLLGPVAPYGTLFGSRAKVNGVLIRYTHTNSLLYINPSAEQWFVRSEASRLVDPSKGHPNNAGYAHMAWLFVRDVHTLTAA